MFVAGSTTQTTLRPPLMMTASELTVTVLVAASDVMCTSANMPANSASSGSIVMVSG